MVAWFGYDIGEGPWPVFVLLGIALLVALVWLVVRQMPLDARTSARPAPSSEHESPVEFLDRTFAQGEIPLAAYPAQHAATVRIAAAYREREKVLEDQGHLG